MLNSLFDRLPMEEYFKSAFEEVVLFDRVVLLHSLLEGEGKLGSYPLELQVCTSCLELLF